MRLKNLLICSTLISTLLVGCGSQPKQISSNITSQNVESENNTEINNDEVKKDIKISVASVSISQVLAEMNQEIVGRPTTKLTLPEQYVNIAEIGSSFSPDFEKVLAVGTELLIGDYMFKDKIEETAKEYGIETFYVNTSTYDAFLTSIEELGQKIGKEKEAEEIITRFEEPLNNIKDVNKDLKVAIIFGSSESNMLATENTYVGSLVKELGVKNIADEIINSGDNILETDSSGYINLNLEQLLKNQPDIILRFGHGNVEEANKAFEKLFTENPAWKNLEAIKNNKIYDLDSNIFGTSANISVDKAFIELGEILNEQQ